MNNVLSRIIFCCLLCGDVKSQLIEEGAKNGERKTERSAKKFIIAAAVVGTAIYVVASNLPRQITFKQNDHLILGDDNGSPYHRPSTEQKCLPRCQKGSIGERTKSLTATVKHTMPLRYPHLNRHLQELPSLPTSGTLVNLGAGLIPSGTGLTTSTFSPFMHELLRFFAGYRFIVVDASASVLNALPSSVYDFSLAQSVVDREGNFGFDEETYRRMLETFLRGVPPRIAPRAFESIQADFRSFEIDENSVDFMFALLSLSHALDSLSTSGGGLASC